MWMDYLMQLQKPSYFPLQTWQRYEALPWLCGGDP